LIVTELKQICVLMEANVLLMVLVFVEMDIMALLVQTVISVY
jgi:hypothetical protein